LPFDERFSVVLSIIRISGTWYENEVLVSLSPIALRLSKIFLSILPLGGLSCDNHKNESYNMTEVRNGRYYVSNLLAFFVGY
jgi:hypothetical protein